MVLKNCAESVCKPLTAIFRRSMEDETLPNDWKKANVCPIFKKGKRNEPENYRPVSLTSVVCKVMESIIKRQMVEYLTSNAFFEGCQHGFVKGRSTLTNLLETFEAWTRILDEGFGVDVAYLDYRKAFDTVPHRRLLVKLDRLGIQGKLLGWIGSFLQNRTMRVVVRNDGSRWIVVKSGVPQGSVLGPLLYLGFVKDLPDWILNGIKMFADDTKLWARIKNMEDSLGLQKDLDTLARWTQDWLLSFNLDKCKIMSIGHAIDTVYTMSDGKKEVVLRKTEVEKDLGVYTSSNLKSSVQCKESVRKAQAVLGLIRRNFKRIDKEDFKTLYNSYIRPHLEYSIQAWSPSLKKDIQSLERVQHRATKMVKGLSKVPYEKRLKILGLSTLEQRRLRGDLIETYKILTGKERVNPEIFFTQAVTTGRLRGHHLKLFVPRCRTNVRKQFFSVRVVSQWNGLPATVVEAESVNSFKNRLDEHWRDMGI